MLYDTCSVSTSRSMTKQQHTVLIFFSWASIISTVGQNIFKCFVNSLIVFIKDNFFGKIQVGWGRYCTKYSAACSLGYGPGFLWATDLSFLFMRYPTYQSSKCMFSWSGQGKCDAIKSKFKSQVKKCDMSLRLPTTRPVWFVLKFQTKSM